MKIVYLGIPGSFTHSAAEKYFGEKTRLLPAKSIADVFSLLTNTQYGIIPLEDSLHGNVVESFDLLGEHNLTIVGEIYVRIHHCLMGIAGVSTEKIKRVYSHWQAIGQCEPFFKKNPHIEPIYMGDTASAAKEVKEHKRQDEAAIASRTAAELYSLEILETDIGKYKENYTRFGVISKTPNQKGNKVSLSFTVKHVPGSLVSALTPFAKNGINLMQIESRPLRETPWEYNFYVDLEVGTIEEKWHKALKELKEATAQVKILGRYKKGAVYEA